MCLCVCMCVLHVCSRKMDDSRAEDMLRRALAVNVLVGLGAEQEDKSITRMLQEVQKRLVSCFFCHRFCDS